MEAKFKRNDLVLAPAHNGEKALAMVQGYNFHMGRVRYTVRAAKIDEKHNTIILSRETWLFWEEQLDAYKKADEKTEKHFRRIPAIIKPKIPSEQTEKHTVSEDN